MEWCNFYLYLIAGNLTIGMITGIYSLVTPSLEGIRNKVEPMYPLVGDIVTGMLAAVERI